MREEKMAASMDAYFEAMAIRASLGDIFAMQKLGDWFRAKLSEEYLTLENEWENAPDCKCGLCMKVTLKTILPLSGQGLHPSKKIISSRKLLPLL